jgi:hypothetical protein
MDDYSRVLVTIHEQLRDIRICLDGREGVIVRLDRLEQSSLARQKRVSQTFTMALSAIAGVIVTFVRDLLKA